MKSDYIFDDYFCGNKISDYGLQHNRVDYATLAKSFDAVLCNNIHEIDDLCEMVNGEYITYVDEDGNEISESEYFEMSETKQRQYYESIPDIFQYYIISDNGMHILSSYTNEIVFYIEKLDIYVWGVTHYGTSWDYVLTEIQCKGASNENNN